MCNYCKKDNEPLLNVGSEVNTMLMLDDDSIEVNVSINRAEVICVKTKINYCPMCGKEL